MTDSHEREKQPGSPVGEIAPPDSPKFSCLGKLFFSEWILRVQLVYEVPRLFAESLSFYRAASMIGRAGCVRRLTTDYRS